MWAGSLHDEEFVKKLLQTVQGLDESVYITRPRMMGMLTLAAEELDVPFYRTPQELASTLKTQTPPLDTVWSGLINSGYKVTSTHCKAGAIKTDAPISLVWDMMKAWVSDSHSAL
jgi:tRNA (guanine26-N2/guanine27-N2)-dimethyltransferase